MKILNDDKYLIDLIDSNMMKLMGVVNYIVLIDDSLYNL